MTERKYISIDLKSFYASVECVDRGLDPLTTNLVVADKSRTEKTICLAVSPSLKSYGISGRARLFEVIQQVERVNSQRALKCKSREFSGKSYDNNLIKKDPSIELSYIVAPPQMARYIKISTKIYGIYLKYVAPEDIHVYSIDEVFIDATYYLEIRKQTAREFAMEMIRDVLSTTGITATAGIGTNLYLAKIAMDIVAKKIPADKDGVRIAELDELSYRYKLWEHRPITDFWRIGKGYASRLEKNGMFTMGDVAVCSEYDENILYKMFGINAELLIDHAWGWEPCTIEDVKKYKPESKSISTGQVLKNPYNYEKSRIIVREMTDLLVLDLVDKKLVTDQIVLNIAYDIESITDANIGYKGNVVTDGYGRKVPKPTHGSINIGKKSSSSDLIIKKALELFDEIVNKNILVRKISIAASRVFYEKDERSENTSEQLDMFTDYITEDERRKTEIIKNERERKKQEAIIALHKRYGKNSVLKGTNLKDGATTKERNNQIGGHKA